MTASDFNFSVPFVHRLRSTTDLLSDEFDVLLELLTPSGTTPPKVQVWMDAGVAEAVPGWGEEFEQKLRAVPDRGHLTGPIVTVPGGEELKNDREAVHRMLSGFDRAGLDRRSYVIVIGGGAVLDAVGFAAAVAHRGIRLIRIPTTTLAQADSGVGVKNAVNLFGKKNWMGSFAVPWGVINDTALLETLPDREFRAGFSEAVKVSLLKSREVFETICETATRIRDRDLSAAVPIIGESVELHIRHITEGGDPFEFLEARPLDYGHWSAHKLEPISRYRIRHGEAVSIGVAVDTMYSSIKYGLSEADAHRTVRCLLDLGLPVHHELLDAPSLFEGLEEFRQHLGGRLTVTMLDGIGEPIDVHEIDEAAMKDAIRMTERIASGYHSKAEAETHIATGSGRELDD